MYYYARSQLIIEMLALYAIFMFFIFSHIQHRLSGVFGMRFTLSIQSIASSLRACSHLPSLIGCVPPSNSLSRLSAYLLRFYSTERIAAHTVVILITFCIVYIFEDLIALLTVGGWDAFCEHISFGVRLRGRICVFRGYFFKFNWRPVLLLTEENPVDPCKERISFYLINRGSLFGLFMEHF